MLGAGPFTPKMHYFSFSPELSKSFINFQPKGGSEDLPLPVYSSFITLDLIGKMRCRHFRPSFMQIEAILASKGVFREILMPFYITLLFIGRLPITKLFDCFLTTWVSSTTLFTDLFWEGGKRNEKRGVKSARIQIV